MSTWKFIPLGWLAISVVLYIGSAVILVIKSHSLTKLIKASEYELWKRYRNQDVVGIKGPVWHFNPLNLPKQVREVFENNVAFETKRRKAVKSYITVLVLFANVSLAIVLCIVVWALF